MTRYTQVIWDWNGTLLDDVQACADAINILLRRRDMPAITLDQYLELFDFPVRNYYLQLGFDFSKDRWDDVAVEYHEAYAITSAASPLRPGVHDTLERLIAAGVGVSILSACETGMLRRMMAERGVLGYFRHVYGLGDLFAHSKVDLGHALLKDTGYAQENTLLVGDTTHDHDVAKALNLPCVLMSGGHQSERKLRTTGSPVVPGLTHALDVILG